MRHVNLIVLFNRTRDSVLLCVRKKEPYRGLSNFVGGKVEPGETGPDAAYRELFEETGIGRDGVKLSHMLDYHFRVSDTLLGVYVGALRREVELVAEVNELYWCDATENFFDMSRFAGEGSMGHILELVKVYGDAVFAE